MTTLKTLTRRYALDHPTRDGSSWNGWCGSLMFRLCDQFGTAPTGDVHNAITVAGRSRPLDPDHYSAPPGAFHFWEWLNDGHVGIDVGGTVFMASSYVSDAVNPSIGYCTVSDYNHQNREAKYLGWSETYANGRVTDFTELASTPSTEFVRAPGGDAGAPLWPKGAAMQRLQQALHDRTKFGEASRYDGKIDGVGGPLTAKGVQVTLNHSRTNGRVGLGLDYYVETPVDGKLGVNNAGGVQKYAYKFGGYRADMDDDPRLLSWTAFIEALEKP